MSILRTTVIAKTDICQFTERVTTLSEQELGRLLSQHKLLVSDIIARGEGLVIKGEGDSFWAIFPSVTRAAQAAIELQRELRLAQVGLLDKDRIAIRVAIAVGDVLHKDDDIFGDTVNLTARIEAVTPPDEIYLSQGAWLAINRTDVQTSLVGQFALRGFTEPESIYKVEHRLGIHCLTDQVVVHPDISGFGAYLRNHLLEDVESLLLGFRRVMELTCDKYGGLLRAYAGDSCLITFSEVARALPAVESMIAQWNSFTAGSDIPCRLRIDVHQGNFYLYGTFMFGDAIDTIDDLANLSRQVIPGRDENVILVTDPVRNSLDEAIWGPKMIDLPTDTRVHLFRFMPEQND